LVVTALSVAAVLVAGGLFASNMGFKLNFLLEAGGASGQNATVLALPFNQQTNLSTASDLIVDIGGGPAGVANPVSDISEYVKSVDNWVPYNGLSGTDFNLETGAGYLVRLKSGSSSINYIVVGSHDPAKQILLEAGGASGQNATVYAYPYHSVSALASELIAEIGGGPAGVGNPVSDVSEYVKAVDNWVPYNGLSGTDISLVPGNGYLIRIKAGESSDLFTPAHY
jgi:hypothetical protein